MSYLDVLLADVTVSYGAGATSNFNGPVRVSNTAEFKHYRKGIPYRIVESEIISVEQSISFIIEEITAEIINDFLLQFGPTPTNVGQVIIVGISLLNGSVHTVTIPSAIVTTAEFSMGGTEVAGLSVIFTNVGLNSISHIVT